MTARVLAIVAVLAACTNTRPRAEVDPSNLLPRHGVLYSVRGMTGEYRTVVDFDARTLVHHETSRNTSIERSLSASQIDELRHLADTAWRERAHGDMPRVTDVASMLVLLDGDDGFQADGTVFDDRWRPGASELVRAIGRATD